MTLLASFSAHGVHYVLADAAITTRGTARLRGPKKSSFGEKHRSTRNGFVREEGLKLYRLGSSVLGGYCGSVWRGMASLAAIKKSLLAGRRFQDCLVEAQERLTDAELLLIGPDDANILRRWFVSETELLEDYDEASVRVTGSVQKPQRDFVEHTFRSIVAVPQIGTNPAHTLAAAIVGVQAHGQRVDLIGQGIGGTIWGLGASASGVVTQKDIMYILYDAKDSAEMPYRIDTLSPVVSGQREHIAYAWRARLRQRGLRVFVGDVSVVSDEEIRAVAPTMMDVQPHYLAFVERRTGAVLLCARASLSDTKLFGLRYLEKTIEFNFDRVILRELAKVEASGPPPSEAAFGFLE